MPGVVADYVNKTRDIDDLDAQYQLLHELEKPYAPDPYRIPEPHDSEWQVAQTLAQRDLHKLEAANPGLSYTELLEKTVSEHRLNVTKEVPFELDYSQNWHDEGYKW